jgi:ketosteroid isomerase-like protein
MLELI